VQDSACALVLVCPNENNFLRSKLFRRWHHRPDAGYLCSIFEAFEEAFETAEVRYAESYETFVFAGQRDLTLQEML
jgi:hypothetical protein